MKFSLINIFILTFIVFIFFACTNDYLEVKGHIINIESSELNKVDKLTLKDFEGKVWILNGNNKSYSHFSSHHLKEHQISGHPVIIKYEKINKDLSIVSIKDVDEYGH